MLLGLPWGSSIVILRINSSPGNYREAENVIRKSLEDNLELDTVAYNTFIKAAMDAGSSDEFQLYTENHLQKKACK